MKLSIGIVGLPNVGKSTLFKILTKQQVHIANYPFTTIDPNIAIAPVPDERLSKLSEATGIKKIVPAVVEFYDIAGLVEGASKGEGLGNQFLAHIRETQAMVMVLRAFRDPEVAHVESTVNPLRDLEIIERELAAKDLETIGRRLPKVESDAKGGKKEAIQERDALVEIQKALEQRQFLTTHRDSYSNVLKNIRIKELNLLTAKPQIYVVNGPDETVKSDLRFKIKELGADSVIADLAHIEEIPELIKKSYEILNLVSFFTFVGENEVRAWTIERGTKAPEAAGVIHTDFEKNFIRAEVIHWQKLLEAGDWNKAKQKGLIRIEGKGYVMQDGDVMVVRHG